MLQALLGRSTLRGHSKAGDRVGGSGVGVASLAEAALRGVGPSLVPGRPAGGGVGCLPGVVGGERARVVGISFRGGGLIVALREAGGGGYPCVQLRDGALAREVGVGAVPRGELWLAAGPPRDVQVGQPGVGQEMAGVERWAGRGREWRRVEGRHRSASSSLPCSLEGGLGGRSTVLRMSHGGHLQVLGGTEGAGGLTDTVHSGHSIAHVGQLQVA